MLRCFSLVAVFSALTFIQKRLRAPFLRSIDGLKNAVISVVAFINNVDFPCFCVAEHKEIVSEKIHLKDCFLNVHDDLCTLVSGSCS